MALRPVKKYITIGENTGEGDAMEHRDRLWPGGYTFLYDDGLFRPSTDTFLLGAFPRLRRGMTVCELGAGTGLLSLLLLAREPELTVTGVELQPQACALFRRTAEENGLQGRMHCLEGDLRQGLLPPGRFRLAVANPPYFPPDAGAVAPDAARRTARAETDCTLAQLCAAAARALTWGGSFCLVHRPDRLADVLEELRRVRLEPKRLRFVHHTAAARPSLFLLEARLGGGVGLTVEPPLLLLHGPDGGETEDVRRAYFRDKEE
jgi:tRNA1(Val) A37 N6-methylase TrmN6